MAHSGGSAATPSADMSVDSMSFRIATSKIRAAVCARGMKTSRRAEGIAVAAIPFRPMTGLDLAETLSRNEWSRTWET